MEFVARLEGLIRAKGLNWMVVSRELKIGKNQMRYWEAQNCLPNGETLKKLADYFDVSIDYLVNGEDPSAVFSTDDAESEYVILEKDHIVWWLTRFTEGNIEDEEFRRHIIDLFINSVTVWDEPDGYRITTLYNLNEGNTKTYKVKSSDFKSNGSPMQSYPNFFFRFGRVFGYTKRHLR